MVMFLERRVHPLIGWLIAGMLVTTSVTVLDARHGGGLWRVLALVPADVWRGELWRLVTWPVVQLGAVSLVFACAILFVCGGDLVSRWGARRFGRYLAAVVLAAGLGTSLLAIVLPIVWHQPYLGGLAVTDAILIAWGLTYPAARVRVYLVLELDGRQLAYGTAGLTLLLAVFVGPGDVLRELIACGLALFVMTRDVSSPR